MEKGERNSSRDGGSDGADRAIDYVWNLGKTLSRLPSETLIEQTAAEYVYALLCSAAMHAFQAENEARMAAMAAARTHIEETLRNLVMREHQVRQEEITDEIVELSATADTR